MHRKERPVRQDRRRKRLRRRVSWSNELTDEQLVKKAESRARRLLLSVEDLFEAFGYYHKFFRWSIFYNSIIWSLAGLNYVMAKQISLTPKSFEYYDMDKVLYPSWRNFTNFEKIGDDMKVSLAVIDNLSQILGPLYILFRYNAERRRQMLEVCVLYCLSALLIFPDYPPVVKIGMALTSFFNKPIRYIALMHIAESVPPKLLPLAMGVMGATDCLFDIVFSFLLIFISNWRYNLIFLGFIIGIFGVIYRLFAPVPILLSLVLKQGTVVQKIIKEQLKDHALIDDTMFTGQANVSQWSKAWQLMRLPKFYRKYLVLLTLLILQNFLEQSCNEVFKKTLSMGVSDAYLVQEIIRGFSSLLGIIFLYYFGHRISLIFHTLLGFYLVAVLCTIRLEQFDICTVTSVPSWTGKVVAAVIGLALEYCSQTLKMIVRIAFIQHIPVEQHTILFAFGMIFQNFCKESLEFVIHLWDFQNWEIYPYGPHFITLIVAFPLALTLPLLDNCAKMPLIATDFQVYYFSRKPWPEERQLDDGAEFEASVETSIE